jgi:hypothetical protein
MEQINRGLSLKKLIPHPLTYSELESLADRCSRIIDKNISDLEYLLRELDRREENNIRDIFRGFRRCVRKIEEVEYFGVSALYYQTPEIGYLNKLIYKSHQEINLPLTPPAVACISTNYYYFQPTTNVIFVPVGESEFLLHLPDAFHEIGHEVLFNKESDLRLEKLNGTYTEAILTLTNYYQKLLTQKKRETGPKDIPRLIEHTHSQWKGYWIQEFFCDLFGLYTLGPAYAWTHLHLTSKISDDIYKFSFILPQTHPSDDARMTMLLVGLRLLGFEDEATTISSVWDSLPFRAATQPVPEYQYAYPIDLMNDLASLFLNGLKETKFSIVSPEKLKSLPEGSIVKLLNEAWNTFWNNPSKFREWEVESIQKLKNTVQK